MKLQLAEQTKSGLVASMVPMPSSVLQRKCTCGGTLGPTGECAACRRRQFGIQPKLKINQPGDKYEQEADRVAEQIIHMPKPSLQHQAVPTEKEADKTIRTKPLANQIIPLIQRQLEPEEEETVQAKQAHSHFPTVTPELATNIQSLRGDGQSLPKSTRAFFEPRFGHDFSQVRIHADARAAHVAQRVQARAFTVGRDVVFGAGEYVPGTIEGQRLLAHELTHVLQQGAIGTRLQRVPSCKDPKATNACKNQTALENRIKDIKAKPKDHGLDATVNFCTRIIEKGVFISIIAKELKEGNNVASVKELTNKLVQINKGIKTASLGNCAIGIKGWTSTDFTEKEKRVKCDARIAAFKKDPKLKENPSFSGVTKWETEPVAKGDKGYEIIVARVEKRTSNLYQGPKSTYAKAIKSLNESWIDKLNEGECVALPVGWKDPRIGKLPPKPTGKLPEDVRKAIATVYAEQTHSFPTASNQRKYIWFAIRKRIETAAGGADLSSVLIPSIFHAIGKPDYKAAWKDLEKGTPASAQVNDAKKIVLDNWTVSPPVEAGAFYFHWRRKGKARTDTAERCFLKLPKKDRTDKAKREAQEKKCAWKHAKEVVIGSDPAVPKKNGWLKMIRGNTAVPNEREGSMYIYP